MLSKYLHPSTVQFWFHCKKSLGIKILITYAEVKCLSVIKGFFPSIPVYWNNNPQWISVLLISELIALLEITNCANVLFKFLVIPV